MSDVRITKEGKERIFKWEFSAVNLTDERVHRVQCREVLTPEMLSRWSATGIFYAQRHRMPSSRLTPKPSRS